MEDDLDILYRIYGEVVARLSSYAAGLTLRPAMGQPLLWSTTAGRLSWRSGRRMPSCQAVSY